MNARGTMRTSRKENKNNRKPEICAISVRKNNLPVKRDVPGKPIVIKTTIKAHQ
jgi:hypothetical protein